MNRGFAWPNLGSEEQEYILVKDGFRVVQKGV